MCGRWRGSQNETLADSNPEASEVLRSNRLAVDRLNDPLVNGDPVLVGEFVVHETLGYVLAAHIECDEDDESQQSGNAHPNPAKPVAAQLLPPRLFSTGKAAAQIENSHNAERGKRGKKTGP